MGTDEVGRWEYSTLLDPPAYAQNAYSVPKELDDLMTRLGFAGGTPDQIVDTRIMSLLDADMTMQIDRVTLSDGRQEISVERVNPESVDCAPGIDVCGQETANVPATQTPLTLTVSRHGVDPFPEAQRPTEYAYYPPAAAGMRGVLVAMRGGEIWNATNGGGGGSPQYASVATDDALRAAVRQLGD
jgi:hypothetical protein